MKRYRPTGRGIAHTLFVILGIIAAFSLIWTSRSAATVKSDLALRSDAELDRSVVTRGEEVPVYVLVRFHASDFEAPNAARPPLNADRTRRGWRAKTPLSVRHCVAGQQRDRLL